MRAAVTLLVACACAARGAPGAAPMPPSPMLPSMQPFPPFMPMLPPFMPQPQATAAQQAGGADMSSFYNNMIAALFTAPGASGIGLPLVPSMPMLPGLPGMAARRDSYFGPHWDTQVQARATSAAESLINSAQLLPQNTDHPSFPPGFPLRFGFSSTYPQVAAMSSGTAAFL